MDFLRITQSGYKDYYFKVDSNGAKIIVVNEGAVNLTPEAITKMLNFRNSYDYSLIKKRMLVSNNVTNPTDIEYNVENGNELLLVRYHLTQRNMIDCPSIKITRINLENGKVTNVIDMPVDVVIAFDNELKRNGYEPTASVIKDILFVKELPNETAADPNLIYYFDKKLYKLNEDQDDFNILTGTFEKVKKLLDFKSLAKENVLYNLTNRYTDYEYNEVYERGIYTYRAEDNSHKLEDLKIIRIKRLPETTSAEDNVIYILTRDDTENNRAKNSAWYLKDNNWTEETREIIDVTKLPFVPIAENGTFYIINEGYVKQAVNNSYVNIGQIVQVDELPDISTVQLKEGIVYVLTQKYGDKPRGTRWVFNHETKEYEEYTETKTDDSSSSEGTDTTIIPTEGTDTTIIPTEGTDTTIIPTQGDDTLQGGGN